MKTTEPLGVSQKLEIHNKPIVYNFSSKASSEITCSPYNTTYIVVSPHSIISNEHKESIILKKAILKLRFTSGDFIDFSNTFESKAQNLSYANSVSLKNFCEQNKFLSQINNIGISYILSKINNNSLEKNLKSLETRLHNSIIENQALSKKLRDLEYELSNLKNMHLAEIRSLKSERDKLEKQLEYKKSSEEEACKTENLRLRGEIDELEKKMENESTFKGMLFQRSIDERNRQQEEIQELKKKTRTNYCD